MPLRSPLPPRLRPAAAVRVAAAAALAVVFAAEASAGPVLDAVRKRGQLLCGVSTGVAGFSAPDSKGRWHGLDVDVCRAVAAAVLRDPEKVRFVPLNAQQRFVGLQGGQVDLLSRNTSWTLSRDASLGFHFTTVTYFDGQGFLVPRRFKVQRATDLKGAQVCVQAGTTTERNLADFSRQHQLNIKPVVFESYEAAFKALFSGRCQAYTADASALASVRNREAPKPDDYLILPDLISKEPLGPMVRRGDDEWTAIVKWTVFALIEAEELGITRAKAAELAARSSDPAVQRLLGKGEDLGRHLGLDAQWAMRAIQAVGHYGEVFERNVGGQSPLKLERGLNRLWRDGGLLYPPPFR